MVPFWWDRGALTPWQLLPLTIATIEQHGLWEANLFADLPPPARCLGRRPRAVAAHLRRPASDGERGAAHEVHTYTWRNRHGMLSTAQDYRPGCGRLPAPHLAGHARRARRSCSPPIPATAPSDQPWRLPRRRPLLDRLGDAPRSAQHRRVALHTYDPAFPPPTTRLRAVRVRAATRTPTSRRSTSTRPSATASGRSPAAATATSRSGRGGRPMATARPVHLSGGLMDDFDLVAEGGADNVWIVELGDAEPFGPVRLVLRIVRRRGDHDRRSGMGCRRPPSRLGVRYESPAEGTVEWRRGAPLMVGGSAVSLEYDHRFDNPYTSIAHGETVVPISRDRGGWELDLGSGTESTDLTESRTKPSCHGPRQRREGSVLDRLPGNCRTRNRLSRQPRHGRREPGHGTAQRTLEAQ